MEYRLSGRITSNDAQKTEEELLELLPDVIDAAQLSYISSAGLRALLKLSQNKTDRVVIKNVRPDVYDIFESTGFTEIFSIEKQLRKVSAKGCKLIGKGYCASVYRLDGERVIKVYDAPRHSGDLSAVQREYEISKKVFLSGLPSIIGFEVVVCDGYYAGIYELVDGDTMGNTIFASPELLEPLTRKMADIGRKMNGIAADDMGLGPATAILTRRRSRLLPHLTDSELAMVDDLIAAIPDKGLMVHGDYHIENVMVQKGDLVLIDVGGMSCGHPVLDLLCLYMKTTEPRYLETRLSMDDCKKIWEIYLDEYFAGKLTADHRSDIEKILSVLADIFMLPAHCTVASTQPEKAKEAKECIKNRLGRISAVSPEQLKDLFRSVDVLY